MCNLQQHIIKFCWFSILKKFEQRRWFKIEWLLFRSVSNWSRRWPYWVILQIFLAKDLFHKINLHVPHKLLKEFWYGLLKFFFILDGFFVLHEFQELVVQIDICRFETFIWCQGFLDITSACLTKSKLRILRVLDKFHILDQSLENLQYA